MTTADTSFITAMARVAPNKPADRRDEGPAGRAPERELGAGATALRRRAATPRTTIIVASVTCRQLARGVDGPPRTLITESRLRPTWVEVEEPHLEPQGYAT
jgi:hypothetical protein